MGTQKVPTTTVVFEPAVSRRAFDAIVNQLRERLRNDELKPGDRLPSERQLAEQLQVSRNTVREAFRMLEIAGLIQIRKGASGGGFVSQADPNVIARSLTDMLSLTAFSLENLTEVRLWLGSTITRLACQRATSEDIERLRANVQRAAALTEASEWEARSEVNHEFLDLLAASTGNPILEMMQQSITAVIREIVMAVGPFEDASILDSRKRLLKHISSRDEDAAAREMEAHLKKVHVKWLNSSSRGRVVPPLP
jgi:GntR family transcriptional repressor for pyruvate dehydrogenase complex